jgi:large subunit ribosomal protein L25
MATATLTARPRTTAGKGAARKLRGANQIPGVVYGHHRQPQPLTIDARELEKLLGHISRSTVVELRIDGRVSKTLIREIQRHPYKPQILHVDFQELVAGEKVTVSIPILLSGIPEGVRALGGTLDQVTRELSVKVDPASIPDRFEADVTALGLNDSLHVRDIAVPAGVEVMDDPDATVCVVAPPRVAEEAAAPAEAPEAAAEPELIRKPKEEGEEGETEEQ